MKNFFTFQPYREGAFFLYFVASWTSPWRGTPGMWLMGVEVQDLKGNTLNVWSAIVRYFWFSLWFLFLNRCSFVAAGVLELGLVEKETVLGFIRSHVYLFTSVKHALLVSFFILPYAWKGQTVPDYLGKAKVAMKTHVWWNRLAD